MLLHSLNSSTCLNTPAVVRKSNQIIVAMHNASIRAKTPKKVEGLYPYQQEMVDNLYADFEGDYTHPDGSHRKRMVAQPMGRARRLVGKLEPGKVYDYEGELLKEHKP